MSEREALVERLKSLKVLLGTDSPEVRGWAPAVQQEAQKIVNATIAALTAQQPQEPSGVREGMLRAAEEIRAERDESCIKDLRERLAKAEAALSDIAEGPQPFHEYLFGIRCGVEDRGLQDNVYEAAEYAYQAGIEYCQDIAASALAQPKGEDHGNG